MSHRDFQETKGVTQDERTTRSHRLDSVRQTLLWALISSLVLLLVAPPAVSHSPIETDITPTRTAPLDLGTNVDQVGSTMQIRGGTRPNNGTNLFHSFDIFTLGTGDIAHFMNDMQRPTNNIFARVIGGEASTIDGTLRTNNPLDAADPMNFGAANLWLVNPSGLLLGPNARVDVGGSVSMSTANYLRFEGTSALFDMLSSPASLGLLDVAPVAAFGFTGSQPPAPIIIQGSRLQVPIGKALSLVGGDITVQAGTLVDGTVQAAGLLAPGGQINLVSVASPGEVLIPSFNTGPNIDGASFTRMGTVMLKEGALLNVGGQLDEFGTPIGNGNSGTLLVRGGQLVMEASAILARTWGTVDQASRAVDIQVSQDVALSNGAVIFTGTFGSGQGGDVVIQAENVRLSDGSIIETSTAGPGSGGNLFLNVGTLRLLGGSSILSSTTGSDSDGDGVTDVIGGAGGNITVQGLRGMGSVADSVVLSGSSVIASEAGDLSEGGGRISITATSLGLDEASSIRSSTNATATDLDGDGVLDITGRGGDIVVAVQHLSILGGSNIVSTTRASNDGAAAGGTVTVQGLGGPGSKAGSVLLSGEDTRIISDSQLGLPGNIAVNARTLTITNGAVIAAGSPQSIGPVGGVRVTADSVLISAGGQIFSRSFAQSAGQVTITAGSLTLDNGSIVASTASQTGGRGGDVVINGGTVSLTNGASIKSQSESFSTTGRAGDITMNVGSLTLANHSEISSSSLGTVAGAGDAGNVTITASGAFTSNASTIATSAEGARGGNIDVTAQSVALSNGTIISASSRAPLLPDEGGNAGNIGIHSGSTFVMRNSSVTTEATQASGGQVVITAPDMVQLIDSKISTSVAGTATDTAGGNISIDPQFVILQNSQIIAQALAGSGGAINVIAGVFIADPNSVVDASSQQGPQGTVNIQSPVQNVGGELAALSDEFASAAALLAQQCAARAADGKFSTFVVAGREGLPLEPGGFLASPSLPSELLGSRLSGQSQQTQFSAVTGLFPMYDARPIQLAKLGNACR